MPTLAASTSTRDNSSSHLCAVAGSEAAARYSLTSGVFPSKSPPSLASAFANPPTADSAMTSSAGVAVPWKTRARYLSTSPPPLPLAPWYSASDAKTLSSRPPASDSARSSSTASRRFWMASRSVSGCETQRRIARAPADVHVLSPRSHRSEPRCVPSCDRSISSCRITFGPSDISPVSDIGRNVGASRSMPSNPNCRNQSNATATARVVCAGRFNAPATSPGDAAPPGDELVRAVNSATAAVTAAVAPPSSYPLHLATLSTLTPLLLPPYIASIIFDVAADTGSTTSTSVGDVRRSRASRPGRIRPSTNSSCRTSPVLASIAATPIRVPRSEPSPSSPGPSATQRR